jgi:hypothetical protein
MILSCDLLDDLPVNLPSPTCEETLFSWCALYHRLSGNGHAADSYFQLFGKRVPGLKHDFPNGLANFCMRTRYALGSPESLALERTLLGYYAPFASSRIYRRALGAVTGEGSGDPKHILGLLASRVGASHPLKSCTECVQRDLLELGYSRWLREHQWPSVWVCREHGIPLRILGGQSRLKDLRYWTLPQDHVANEWQELPALSAGSISNLTKIASVTIGLAQTPFLMEDSRLRVTYRIGVKDRGWVAFDGSTRMAAMNSEFQAQFGALRVIPGFGFLVEADPNSGGVLGLLTRQLPGLHHPAKHAVAIAFLFESIADFVSAYRQAGNVTDVDSRKLLVADWREELRRLVAIEKWSVSRAATSLGMPISQACRWLDTEGVAYGKRARVSSVKRGRIAVLLQEGNDYQRVADEVGVKKGLVRAFAASNPELKSRWQQRRFENARELHRAHATELFAAHRGVSIKALKAVPGNGLTWLERHDRGWLIENAPNLFSPK